MTRFAALASAAALAGSCAAAPPPSPPRGPSAPPQSNVERSPHVMEKAQLARVVVVMTGFRNAKGSALVGLFAKREGFPDGKHATLRLPAVIEGGQARVTFEDVAPGVYAVSALHDEDGDFEMGTNFLGMPTEGYAASNNARRMFGPPAWDDARFTVAAGTTEVQTLRIVYP